MSALPPPFAVRSTPVVGAATSIVTGGTAVTVFPAGSIVNVADIVNPPNASEVLYVDITTVAVAGSASSVPLMPGQPFHICGPLTTAVSAVAATGGHTCIAVRY